MNEFNVLNISGGSGELSLQNVVSARLVGVGAVAFSFGNTPLTNMNGIDRLTPSRPDLWWPTGTTTVQFYTTGACSILVEEVSGTSQSDPIGYGQVSVKLPPYNASGNGSKNDTAAINAAQTYASSLGLELVFPPGNYLVTPGAISLPANMVWRGYGDARIVTKETAIYNIMVIIHADNTKIINMGFDQMGDSALLPTTPTGCHILHYNNFNTAELQGCKFWSYGITAVLSQPNNNYGNSIKVRECEAIWRRNVDTYYDTSVFNIDGIEVICDNNKVTAVKPITATNVNWMPETAFELHMPSGHAFNNTATRCKNAIIHVEAPMQYATYDDMIHGGVQIANNRAIKCLELVSVWGANTLSGVVTRNLDIHDNYHEGRLGGNGGGLKPTTSIELRNGNINGSYFRNVKIHHNLIEFTSTKYVSLTNKISFSGNVITTTGDDFSDMTVGDYIKISGCTVNVANNVTARLITAITAKTITVNGAAFTSGAETASITIQIDVDNWIGGSVDYSYCGAIKGVTSNSIEDLEVQNNTIYNWPFAALSFHAVTGQHKRLRISDNNIIDCSYSQPSVAKHHGVFSFNNCVDVDMQFNKIVKVGRQPLKLIYLGATGGTGLKFVNNDVLTLTSWDAAYETDDTILKTMITDVPAFLLLGCKPVIGGYGAGTALPATTGTVTITMDSTFKSVTPTGALTLNASGGVIGQKMTLFVNTSGVTSYNITFGTNFRANGVLATGTVTAKIFAIKFEYDGTNWVETIRTIAL